jgi:hypothetical protein
MREREREREEKSNFLTLKLTVNLDDGRFVAVIAGELQ